MNQLEVNEKRDNSPGGSPDDPANLDKEALRRIDQFRRETGEEPQEIRHSTKVRITNAISQETSILHRKLAAVLERTSDMEIRRLLKALSQRYLCLGIDELFEDPSSSDALVARTNAYLARTRLGIKIHSRNGFLLLGPEEEKAGNIDIVNNPETRKTLHYTGTKIVKPTAKQAAPTVPAAAEKTSKKTYLGCIKANVAVFKQGQFSLEYQIAELLAEAADNSDIDPERGYGLTKAQIADRLRIADYNIHHGVITKLTTALRKIGIELTTLPSNLKLGIDEDIYAIGWAPSADLPKNIQDDVPGKNDDDDDWTQPTKKRTKQVPSKNTVDTRLVEGSPDDIFPAFRDTKIATAEEFNDLIYGTVESLCTDIGEMGKREATKLLRSVKALRINPLLQARVDNWKERLLTGIRSVKHQALQPKKVEGLMLGIDIDKK